MNIFERCLDCFISLLLLLLQISNKVAESELLLKHHLFTRPHTSFISRSNFAQPFCTQKGYFIPTASDFKRSFQFFFFLRGSAKWFSANGNKEVYCRDILHLLQLSLLAYVDMLFLNFSLFVFFPDLTILRINNPLSIFSLQNCYCHFYTVVENIRTCTIIHNPLHTHPSYCSFKLNFPGIRIPREKAIPRKSNIFVQRMQGRWR